MASGLPSELVREIEIFSSIYVFKRRVDEDDTAHHLAGIEVFRRNRTLLSYIKIVSVQHSPDRSMVHKKEPMQSSTAELLHLIAAPSVLKFSFVGWEGETTPEFQRGIVALVRSPHLISLSLINAPVQLADMVESPHLQHLELRLAAYYQARPREDQLFLVAFQPTVTQRKRPTSLALIPDGATVGLLVGKSSSFDLDAVEELELDSPCYTRGNTLLLLQRCGPSLRRLRIATDALSFYVVSCCLTQLQQLQELLVDEELFLGDVNPYDVLPSFLDAFPSPNSLSYVEIEKIYDGEGIFPDSASGFGARLDSVLANRSRFAKLHTVKFRHTIVKRPKPTPEEWEVKERGYWPALREAGVLIVMLRDF
ncbi:hypothetical protein BKA70DRAFT_1560061 [Coprinopsis sp. MPI-PUGE-AT-0042]|nr:hypothetical protein BKA70DRAFT_1560061 [Coprinopsis sp. MPI-PUGE-AT-0042]